MESTSLNTYKRAFSANEDIKGAAESYKNKTPTQIAKTVIGILTLGIGYGIIYLVEKLTIRDPKVREFCDNAIKIHNDLSTAVVNCLTEATVALGNDRGNITFKEVKTDNGARIVTISHGKHEVEIEGSLESIVKKIEDDLRASPGFYNLKYWNGPLDKKRVMLNVETGPDVEKINLNNVGYIRIGSGSRGVVFADKTRQIVIKCFNEELATSEIKYEMTMFNHWAKKFGGPDEKCKIVNVTSGGFNTYGLMMPYRDGTRPENDEVTVAVKKLFDAGILMGDPSTENFIKVGECVFPIDFGLMFIKSTEYPNHLSETLARNIVHDYVRGGHLRISEDIKKKYNEYITDVDEICHEIPNTNVFYLRQAGLR